LLLGTVQGLTEFLPVSSSAHLILVRAFLGWNEDAISVPFDVACHVGTLVAVVAFFRADILTMVRAIPRALSADPGTDGRRIWLIAVGTVPVVIVGLLFNKWLEAHTRTPMVAAATLALGGALFFVVERVRCPPLAEDALTMAGAGAIGVAQSAALVTGVSRSGATITMGMFLGLSRAAAARFTFLMSLPAILAAAAKEGLDLRHQPQPLTSHDLLIFAVGMLTSAAVGYVTVRFFLRYLTTHRLDVFGWYRIALAVATLVWLATR
jgi:undecaprenyl-diphosphatase